MTRHFLGFCCAFNHNTLSGMLRGQRLAGIIENIEEKFDKITAQQLHLTQKNLTKVDYAPKWGIQVTIVQRVFLQFDSNRFDFIWSVKSEQTNLFLFNQNKPIFFCLERINCRSGHFVWMESCFGETRFLGNSGKTISIFKAYLRTSTSFVLLLLLDSDYKKTNAFNLVIRICFVTLFRFISLFFLYLLSLYDYNYGNCLPFGLSFRFLFAFSCLLSNVPLSPFLSFSFRINL